MKRILLNAVKKTNNLGYFALVSEKDYSKVSKYNWSLVKSGTNFYARTYINGKHVQMHRFILELTDKRVYVDHKDKNGLNNTRRNIRICTNSQNQKNKKPRGISKYLGVSKSKLPIKKPWICSIKANGKYIISYHKTEIETAISYDKLAKKHHKRFANLNFK